MNKLLIALIGLSLISCDSAYQEEQKRQEEYQSQIKGFDAQCIEEFTYKGHDYIWISVGHRAGLVHSPECKKCYAKFD